MVTRSGAAGPSLHNPITNPNRQAMKQGGYTPMHIVSAEEKALFEKAMRALIGVRYEPLIVATQVVAGTNYRFICNASIPGKDEYVAAVTIFEPLPGQGEPVPTNIERI